tara:strand:- start:939 stop:1478 length:540 start_codon:yes stop_codon:yes gene_type:complete
VIVCLINVLTISRIFLAIAIFLLLSINNNYIFALTLFILAGVSDYFDGALARKYNATTQLGEVLDPIADKILIIFLFFGLAINLSSYLIGFVASIIIAREMWVSALRDLNARNNNTEATKVIYIGKIKTFIQLFTITIYLLGLAFSKMLLIIIADILLIIALIVTLYSGYIYTINTFKN